VDRLVDINKAFPVVVEIGTGTGAHVSKRLHAIADAQVQRQSEERVAAAAASDAATAAAAAAAAEAAAAGGSSSSSQRVAPPTQSVPDRGMIGTLHLCDSSPEALARTREYWSSHPIPSGRRHEYHVVDEEGALPFADASVDLVVSSMSMHWINDLPGFFKRVRRVLKPDGVFLAAMVGGATLQELRSSFTVADLERLGGVQAHVSPFAYGRDCGDLMASAGFTMPTGKLMHTHAVSLLERRRNLLVTDSMPVVIRVLLLVCPAQWIRTC
jgi:SAM-dependent methyltransferase